MDGADAINYILMNNIEGAIVECGVEHGNFEYIWINELMKNNTTRDIYLYDTFAGLTKPGNFDYSCENATIIKATNHEIHKAWERNIISDKINGLCYVPLEVVKIRLNSTGYPQDKLHYIVGDVMDTLKDKNNIPSKIAILRLDTDWYESSKFELEQMYDNVVNGGVIIFDDYYQWYGQELATNEYFESINMKYNFVNIGNQKTAAIIKYSP
jgi:O-methyltransferase